MGTNCGIHPEPQTANQCFVSVGDPAFDDNGMPGFCTLEGSVGDSYRNSYCQAMSSGSEWAASKTNIGGCSYNDCIPYQDFGFGCCKGCCGIIGDGLQCTRTTFTGTPLTCCFNDLACTAPAPGSNPPECFSDVAKQNTCADGNNGQPNYRSLVSTDCQDVLYQYCTGTLPTDIPGSAAWLDRWTVNDGGPGSCNYAVARNMFAVGGTGHCFTPPPPEPGVCNLPPPLPIDAQGYFWAQNVVGGAIANFQALGFSLGSLPGFSGYNPWQDFIYENVCCPYPGLCQPGLDEVCANKTPENISLNPALAQWCGCHLSDEAYQSYSVQFNIPPQCTPMCNRVGTIPIVGLNAAPVRCEQNICLIDGVTVNLINSQIGGGIDFNQICDNCEGAQCSCIVSNTTVDINNSTIGGNVVPVSTGCGTISCNQTNPGTTGPNVIPVSCETSGFNPYAQYEANVAAAKQEAEKTSWWWTLLALGIALFLIFIIILFVYPMMKPAVTPTSATGPVREPGVRSILDPTPVPTEFARAQSINSIEYRESVISEQFARGPKIVSIEDREIVRPVPNYALSEGEFRSINA